MYTDSEKQILHYYFTNLDQPIFAVKNFHPEVWALMQARYSRAKEGLRESFLSLLKEDSNNFDQVKAEIEKMQGGIELEHATEKAISFMEKWVLGYGHSSVAEGAVIGTGVEGVSILATKVIEDNRLSSFCEKSTRYVSFDEDSFYLDKKLMASPYAAEVQAYIKELFETYTKLHEPVLQHIEQAAPRTGTTSEAAWKRSCAARRFDAIRYLLPTCTKTSLGWTVNARQLAHGIRKMLSHPLGEMQDIGQSMKTEASKVLPSLLKYAHENHHLKQTEKSMRTLSSFIEVPSYEPEEVKLVQAPEVDEIIMSAILYRYKNDNFVDIHKKVLTMKQDARELLFDTFMQHMDEHDTPLRELEHVNFTFEVVMDYGGFRDLQRHRIATQTNPLLTTDLGYAIPDDIKNAGVLETYVQVMDKARVLFNKLRERYPYEAQYIIPLGYKKRWLITLNLRALHHLIKVRSTPAGHVSYRRVVWLMYEALKEKYPLLTKYMRCTYKEESLGRLQAEERIENA